MNRYRVELQLAISEEFSFNSHGTTVETTNHAAGLGNKSARGGVQSPRARWGSEKTTEICLDKPTDDP